MSRQGEGGRADRESCGRIDQVITGSVHSFFYRRHPEKRKAGCLCSGHLPKGRYKW